MFIRMVSVVIVCLCAVPTFADEPKAGQEDNIVLADERKIANEIDLLISAQWDKEEVVPSAVASDEEWMRRVYLDLTGRIPSSTQARDFLDDTDPQKRYRLIDKLLQSSRYVTQFTNYWRDALLPEVNADIRRRFMAPGFEAWLRQQLMRNAPYDQFVREIVTVELSGQQGQALAYSGYGQASPISFYMAKESQPESYASAVARSFLGVRIGCAQCHDHPFDTWKREEFYGFAKFFAGIQRRGNANFGLLNESIDILTFKIPGTETTVEPAFLNDSTKVEVNAPPRVVLANWITSKQNPYFKRAAVNRVWSHLFGRGLVEPFDDFSGSNPATHPEVLDLLAAAFVENGFDLKFLLRTIASTHAYQLSSAMDDESQTSPDLYSRMNVKGLTANQIADSVAQATGSYQRFQSVNRFAVQSQGNQAELTEMFKNDANSPIDRETSILQALAMMNGQFIASVTDLLQSRTLSAIADFPGDSNAERIENLFIVTLSRKPTTQEMKRFGEYVDSGGPEKDSRKALADVFWALLNSSEFLFNH